MRRGYIRCVPRPQSHFANTQRRLWSMPNMQTNISVHSVMMQLCSAISTAIAPESHPKSTRMHTSTSVCAAYQSTTIDFRYTTTTNHHQFRLHPKSAQDLRHWQRSIYCYTGHTPRRRQPSMPDQCSWNVRLCSDFQLPSGRGSAVEAVWCFIRAYGSRVRRQGPKA